MVPCMQLKSAYNTYRNVVGVIVLQEVSQEVVETLVVGDLISTLTYSKNPKMQKIMKEKPKYSFEYRCF